MFTLGIILLIAGCVLSIWCKLKTREEIRALAPQWVLLRNSAIEEIETRKRIRKKDAVILMVIGGLIVLVTAVFN